MRRVCKQAISVIRRWVRREGGDLLLCRWLLPLVLLQITATAAAVCLALAAADEPTKALPEPMTVAITVDDLPNHGNLVGNLSRTKIAQGLLDAFKENGVEHVYGFSRKFNPDDPSQKELFAIWLNAGNPLGNHTYDHLNLERVTARDFVANIKKMDRTLQALAPISPLIAQRRVFRYPYLAEGETLGKRDAVRSYLARNGYRIAEVTIDYNDDEWNAAYTRCVSLHDDRSIAWLKKNIVDNAERHFHAARATAKRLFGRDIKHILLVHVGAFDALMLDTILKDLRSKGVRFTTFDDAISDPVYKINPNYAFEGGGLTFLEQIAEARKVDVSPSLDMTYPVEDLAKVCQTRPGSK